MDMLLHEAERQSQGFLRCLDAAQSPGVPPRVRGSICAPQVCEVHEVATMVAAYFF
ncbi:unnamed protein product, partial [Polarella glacialis]